MEKKDELISVIIPIYNVEKYLERCLSSVIEQTYKNIEIILINDGSTDKSGNICKLAEQRDRRIKYIEQKNEGVSVARNNGIDNSSGEYIIFIDSDDFIEKNMIEKMYNQVYGQNAEICVCNYQYISINNKIIKTSNINKNDTKTFKFIDNILIEEKYGGYLWNKIYNADIIKKNNIRFKDNVKIMEDIIFNLEYYKYIKKITICPEIFYNYIKREGSALDLQHREFNYLKSFEYIIDILDRYKNKNCNEYKLKYVMENKKAKILNKSVDLSAEENKKNLEQYKKEKVFLKYGKLSTKIKLIVLYIFPWIYKVYK